MSTIPRPQNIESLKFRTFRRGMATLEPLETRRLLAGNVVATADPTTGGWRIAGDSNGNEISIEWHVFTSTLTLTGLSGTTVNESASPLTLAQIFLPLLQIDLGNGNDRLVVAPDRFQVGGGGALNVFTGNGADRVDINSLAFSQMSIRTGNGDDQVNVGDVVGFDFMEIDTGKGADAVSFAGGQYVESFVALSGGNGFDAVTDVIRLIGGYTIDGFESISL
jgi:hypothetical protein